MSRKVNRAIYHLQAALVSCNYAIKVMDDEQSEVFSSETIEELEATRESIESIIESLEYDNN